MVQNGSKCNTETDSTVENQHMSRSRKTLGKMAQVSHVEIHETNISQSSLLADPSWVQKITSVPHSLLTLRIDSPDDRYTKLKMCISELTLDTYQHTPVAYVTMHCMI
jgi:hypothetical protein